MNLGLLPLFGLLAFLPDDLDRKDPTGVAGPTLRDYRWGDTMSFVFVDPEKKKEDRAEARYPWIRLFEAGQDAKKRDASRVLDFLKWARGQSELFPDEDKKPGLIVVLRGLRFVPTQDKPYRARFLGEFNAFETEIPDERMKDLLDGKTVTVQFKQNVSRSAVVARYKIETDIKIRLALEGKALAVYSLSGNGAIQESSVISTTRHVSPTVEKGNDKRQQPIYTASPGDLPDLPVLD